MATNVLKFKETDDKKYKVSFQASGKVHVFLDRVDNSDVMIYLYPKNYDPVLYKKVTPDRTDVLLEFVIPGSGDIFVDIVSGTEVTQGCYLTEEETFVYSVPASSVIFDDGKSFQQKLESGELKGQKGDKGATGATGAKGETRVLPVLPVLKVQPVLKVLLALPGRRELTVNPLRQSASPPILPARSPVGNARCLITQRLPSPLPRLPFDDFSRLSRFFTYWSHGDTLTVSISSKVL